MKILIFVIVLLCAAVLAGCVNMNGRQDPEEIVCGGTTDNTDPNAPKTIKSKTITVYRANFYLEGEWSRTKRDREFSFVIARNDKDVLTVSEEELKISRTADTALLEELQKIIDEEKLVQKNGVYRVTAGLPPPYQPCSVSVLYASGEKLTFTENNDPEAKWAQKTYMAFARWFNSKGEDALMPPENKDRLKYLSFRVNRDGFLTEYGAVTDDEHPEERFLRQRITPMTEESASSSGIVKRRIEYPADYYDRVSAIAAKYDLRPFDERSVFYGIGRDTEKDRDGDGDVYIALQYENGHRLLINAARPEDIKYLKSFTEELLEYHKALFDKIPDEG